MKKALIVAFSVFSLSSFAIAAPAAPSQKGHQQWQQNHLDKMQQSLDLTDAQRQQIELIYQNAQQQQKAIRDEVSNQVKGVLTAEQQAKFDKQREAQKEKMRSFKEGKADGKKAHAKKGKHAKDGNWQGKKHQRQAK